MMQSWQICHARQEANCGAQGLAKATVKQVTNKVWLEEILNCICDIILFEQQALCLCF